jgi:aspartate/methionine/tyrosine aminotransferase
VFIPFQVEQYMSEHEQQAEFHFAESGVHPLTFGEILEICGLDFEALSTVLLDYPEVNGTLALRENIAALYDGATADNVLVTVGASEANHIVASSLLKPGDHVVAFRPTYQQLPGNAENIGVTVDTVDMSEDRDWAIDTAELETKVTDKTRFIHIVNPNNPTGHILEDEERSAIIRSAEKVGAWIVADEVYAGAEREKNHATPSFWGEFDKVITINSMSKAYGLPGLRLGWVVAPAEQITEFWRRHEYATISATVLAMTLAERALSTNVRPQLIARTRRLIKTGFDHLTDTLSLHPGVFSVVPPQASAMSFVKYNLPIDSMTFAKRLLSEKRTLVVPGACFGLENHFRISSALPTDYLSKGLGRINELVADVLSDD